MAYLEPIVVRGIRRAMKEAGGQKVPVLAGHKLLYRCNLECKMCPFWRREDEELLTVAEEIQMMDALVHAGVSFLGFEGGEPLLRRDVPEILAASHERFHTSMVSNGWLLKNRFHEIKDSLNSLFVSLDGIGAMHDYLRGIPRSYDKAIEGIRTATGTVPVAISSTLTKDNLLQAEPLVDLAEKLGVAITFQVAFDYSTADAMSPLGPDLLEALQTLRALRVDGAPIMQSPEYFDAVINSWYHGKSWHCKPWLTINIDPRGRVVLPCYVLREYGGEVPVWDLDIPTLWNSYDWSSFESCNKCALSCYLEPSLFTLTNLGMFRDRVVKSAVGYLSRGWQRHVSGPRVAAASN